MPESGDADKLNPADYIITRKRKKYRFALFYNSPLCFEAEEWDKSFTPNVVEIGAGTGLFSVMQAARSPRENYIAIDVKGDRLQKGAYKAAEMDLKNVRFLRARAGQLNELVATHSLDSLWITFPDPFSKKHSSGRRLTHPQFLRQYGQLLKANGVLYFKTDTTNLFTWSLEQLVMEGWQIKELSFDLHESDLADEYKVQTTYEQRFISEGLKVKFVKALPPQIVA